MSQVTSDLALAASDFRAVMARLGNVEHVLARTDFPDSDTRRHALRGLATEVGGVKTEVERLLGKIEFVSAGVMTYRTDQSNPCAVYGLAPGGRGLWMWPKPEFVCCFQNVNGLVSIVRPGDRSPPNHPNHIPELPLAVRWIAESGPSVVGTPGKLLPYDGTCFRRVGMLVKTLEHLTSSDLLHGLAGVDTKKGAVAYLAEAYKKSEDEVDLRQTVTVWTVEVLQKWTPVQD